MRLFIKQCLYLFIIMLMIDPLFYLLLSYQQNHVYDNRLNRSINGELNTDILVLGSSRAARNIIAGQIEDSIHSKCFNLSYPGSDLSFHAFLLNTYLLKNKKPKIVLLTLDDSLSLKNNEFLTFRNDVLYPLAKLNHINDVLIKNNENPLISKCLYTFRAEKSSFKKASAFIGETDTLWNCGSMPISFTKANYSFNYNHNNTSYSATGENPLLVDGLLEIQSVCKSNGIKLVFVFPPNYKNHNLAFEKRIRDITENQIQCMVYDQSENRYKNAYYYYDMGHLTLNGARIFTNEIIAFLRSNSIQ